jgi:asparagine synthase (glutamine-hydrolysing)
MIGAVPPLHLESAEQPPIALTRLLCETYLRCNGIVQADRLSMAYSVEPRNPFLDHCLVETVIGLRKTQRDVDLPPKSWLKNAIADLVPPAIRNRRKRGFQPPDDWRPALVREYSGLLKTGELASSGLFRGEQLARTTALAFPLITLELWSRELRRYCV